MSDGRIRFDDAKLNDIDLVRGVFLRRLREDRTWKQVGDDTNLDQYVEFPSREHRVRFEELENQILWELISQGVLIPGNVWGGGTSEANLPWFRITDYGRRVIAAGKIIPHEPTSYLSELRNAGPFCVDDVSMGYVQEALLCFNRGCYTAAVLLLGIAAEAIVLKLSEHCATSAPERSVQEKFKNLPDSVRQKHRRLVHLYESLPATTRRDELPNGLDMSLKSAYDMIRRQRNDLGHPQQVPPAVDREHAFVSLQVLPTLVRDFEALADFYRRRKEPQTH